MKNLVAAIIIGGAVAASQSALAQGTFVANDLYLGFQNSAGGGSANYIINLGPSSGIINGSSVVNLSADFSLSSFNSSALVGTNSTTIVGGVVGASDAGNPSDVFLTEFRSGGAGTPSVPGSTAPGGMTRAQDNTAYTAVSPLDAPAAGTSVLDTSESWQTYVEPTFSSGSFYGNTSVNPDSSIVTNTVLYEDLWRTTNSALSGSKPFAYLGYFTITPTGGGSSLTFTPASAVGVLGSPKIVSFTKTGTTMKLIWTTVATHTYQLQATISLYPTNWANVGSSQLANFSFMTNSDTAATSGTKFYRVTGQ